MSCIHFVWAACLLGALVPAQSRVLLEIEAPAETYVSQPCEVRIRIGYDVTWFAKQGVSLFRQQVDLPLHVELPWIGDSAERDVRLMPARTGDTLGVVVGEQYLEADRIQTIDWQRNGRSFAGVVVRVRWLPKSKGVTFVAPVVARYAFATKFQDHLLRGREPIDQQERSEASVSAEIRVLPLPPFAPDGWTGAVGEFQLAVTTAGREIRVGDTFEAELSVWGDGDLAGFGVPQPPAIDGFHVLGIRELEVEAGKGRRFGYDVLALRSGLASMPGIPFVYFSPSQKAYVTVFTGTAPVRVLPQRIDERLPKQVQKLIEEDAAKQNPGLPSWVWRWGFVLLMVVGLGMHRFGKRSNGNRHLLDRVHDLRVAVSRDAGPDKVADLYEQIMSLVAKTPVFSAPSVWRALSGRGVAPEGLERLQEVHATLDAARFGGPMPPADEIIAVVETVVAAS